MLNQLTYMAVDEAVILTVKVILNDHICNLVPCMIIQHQSAQHRLLGLYRVRWRLIGLDRLIITDVGEDLCHRICLERQVAG
ncbi:MAG: hypothetical protein JW384_00919 [Nitrosomonadaceae bacterium]|nr:hypothetical protein [Nitrosomonadaceae bacterium]